ncbi:hypothetical protein GAY28_37845, partial [Azospirillum brasilense]|nr:hypothetical protein [Azospirillum brasilense]
PALPGPRTRLERGRPGGLELAASRRRPLRALGDGAVALGGASDGRVKARVQRSVDRVLTFQRTDGAFAAWSPKGEADSWLTAYALDFLGRAKAAGYRVPEGPYRKGLDGLRGALDNAWVEADEQPARAYALYVLARAKMIDAGAVRYFQETFWDKLQTDFARAQVATAIAALGDKDRAAEAFGRLSGARVVSASLRDYGSSPRDEAGVVGPVGEGGVGWRGRLAPGPQTPVTHSRTARPTPRQGAGGGSHRAAAPGDRGPRG